MKPAELLNEAAEVIETAGWYQGNFQGPDGYCALGAMREVVGCNHPAYSETELAVRHKEYGKAKKALKAVMIEQLDPEMNPRTPWAIAKINDRRGRTKEEIVACMRKAANNLEA